MDKLLPNTTTGPTCVGGKCGAAAINATGLTAEQDSIRSVNAALVTNLIIGSLCLTGFLVFRTFMKQYQLRSILPQITVRPPPLPRNTFIQKVFGWLVPVFIKSDAYILRAAGLDALVLQKIHAVGLQICVPLAIIGCGLLLPLQMREAFMIGDSSYGRLTAANIWPGSPVMWAHCVMLFVMLAWIFTLLEFHTKEYATVRQHYLKGSDDPNYWRDLHMAEADGTLVHKQSKLLAVVGEAKHEQDLEQMLLELDETVQKRTWWRRMMVSLTSWTGQEGAEAASLLGMALLHSKSKKRKGQKSGEATGEATPSATGRMHIDLASDLIQGDFVRDAKLRSSGHTPTQATTPATPGSPASPAKGATAGSSTLLSLGTMPPKRGAGGDGAGGDAAAAAGGGSPFAGQQHTKHHHLLHPKKGGGAGGANKGPSKGKGGSSSSNDDDGDDEVLEAPLDPCDLEVENISNLVSHKWWTQVEHVATSDGRLRRLTTEESQAEEVRQVMLAKPSVRYRKTINAVDHRGRRSAVHAQQYAVLVTNVNHPCYPEYHMAQKKGPPGAHMCGNLDKEAYPPAVKYDLEGPLHGHAEVSPAIKGRFSSGTLTPSKSFDPTSSGKLDAEIASAAVRAAGAAGGANGKSSGSGGAKEAAAGDVEMGVTSTTSTSSQPARVDRSFMPHPHINAAPLHHKDITGGPGQREVVPIIPKVGGQEEEGADDSAPAGDGAAATATSSSAPARQRSGKELWALVRQFAADKKTPGRSLYLLSRDREYSIVGHVFSQLFPDDYDRVVPVFNYRRVDLLMRRWDVRQGQLERAEWKLKQTGVRPMRKTKCCGGVQVDAIDWLREEIEKLEDAILMERDAALVYGQTPSWFVLFRSQKAAAIAASCNILPMNQDLFQVHPAPGPEEVNWEALWFNHSQRRLRQFITTPFAILVVFAPVSLLTSAISQLNSTFCTAVKWDFYCGKSAISNILRGLVTGFLPSLLIILWQGLCMPRLVYLVAQSEGRHYSLSAVDRRMGELYFYWDIFNMFAQGVLGAAAVNAAAGSREALTKSGELFNAPQEIPRIIGQALPASSKFFFTYIIMRTFMSVPLRFLITQPGVWQCWLRLCDIFSKDSSVPPRTRFMRYAIRSPRYGVEYGSTLLILLISLAFALISPLITLFGAAFCGGMWMYWRYQLMYNYQRKYESGGLMWHFFVNRVLVCCGIMCAFTGCLLIIKQGFVQAALIWLFGIVGTISFASHLNRKYMNAIVEMPLYLANAAPRARVPSSIYVPPPLQANGLGWYPEFNKVWEWFGMPGYSW